MAKDSDLDPLKYSDYRRYLSDYYMEQKKRNPAFSYRYFAKKLGVNSSGIYKDIVAGRTGMTRNLILKFTAAISMNPSESEYFENMVYYAGAGNLEEKKHFFEKMLKLTSPRSSCIQATHYEYFSKWYYVALRELFAARDFQDIDHSRMAKALIPGITRGEAKKAVEFLLQRGFVKPDSKGFLRPSEPSLTTGPDVISMSIANFQKGMMDLAKDAIDRFPAPKRDISSVTMSIPAARLDEFKAEIRAFRKKLVAMTQAQEQMDTVFQFNVQFFPLTDFQPQEGTL